MGTAARSLVVIALVWLTADALTAQTRSRSLAGWRWTQGFEGDPAPLNRFGQSVDSEGNWLVIGDAQDGAYLYMWDSRRWTLHRRFLPPFANTSYGFQVAISGETLAISARDEGSSSGAAYLYGRNVGGPDAWGLIRRVTVSGLQPGDEFGESLDLEGDTFVVSAPGHRTPGDGVGSIFVFEEHIGGPGAWGFFQELRPPGGETGASFGRDLDLSGDTLAAFGRDLVSGIYRDHGYVIERPRGLEGDWVHKATMGPFVSGFTVPVVATDGEWFFMSQLDSGEVFVHSRDQGGPGAWGYVRTLTTPDGLPNDGFGWSISIHGDQALIGAPFHDVLPLSSTTGAAYILERDRGGPGQWGVVKKLLPPDIGNLDSIGIAGWLGEDRAFVSGQNLLLTGKAHEFRLLPKRHRNFGYQLK